MESNTRWSGEWHIVNTATGQSLESWRDKWRADYFCTAVNEHEQRNNRPAVYVVEEHPTGWRRTNT